MRTFATLLVVLSLGACATSGTEMQAECEASYTAFPEMFRCTRAAVAARNPSVLRDDRAKLYLLRGEQLAEQVEAGKISSLDAKVAWQSLYVELKSAKQQEVAGQMAAVSRSLDATSRALQPPPVVSTPAASPAVVLMQPAARRISCVSQKIGATLQTDCN